MLGQRQVLQLLRALRRDPAAAGDLASIAHRAGWSRFHVHRRFVAVVGETPKHYTLRLRLERAALHLAGTDEPVSRIARRAGFGSHEGFSRAFRRHLGTSPSDYRALARARGAAAPRHAALTRAIGPCIGLFHIPDFPRRDPMSDPTIERQERAAVPALFMRRRVSHAEIQGALAQCLPAVYVHCQQNGLAMAGPPFTRYAEVGHGLMTLECGIPLVEPAPGTEAIESGELQAGTAAVAIHEGAYDTLSETYAALERWLEAEGLQPAGPPWETYLTDPAEHPDPADWRTEVCMPFQEA